MFLHMLCFCYVPRDNARRSTKTYVIFGQLRTLDRCPFQNDDLYADTNTFVMIRHRHATAAIFQRSDTQVVRQGRTYLIIARSRATSSDIWSMLIGLLLPTRQDRRKLAFLLTTNQQQRTMHRRSADEDGWIGKVTRSQHLTASG